MKNKTVLIAVEQGFSVRYLLRSDLFKVLKESGVRIVILSPNADEDYFQVEFKSENIFLERYEYEKYDKYNSKLHLFFTLARLYSRNNKYFINFSDYWYRHYRLQRKDVSLKKKIFDLFLYVMVFLLSNYKLARKIEPIVESFFTPDIHKHIFEKYKLDMVLITSLGTLSNDRFIMHEARRNGARVVPLVLSWDNTTTRGLAGAKFDHVVAWTEIMKEELIKHHDVSPQDIFVGGVTQYDEYFKDENLYSREEIFTKMGLDPSRKTLFYCLESPTQYPWNLKLLDLMARLIKENAFSKPCQVIARLHPIYFRIKDGKFRFQKDIDALKELQNKYPHMHFDYPEILSQKMSFDMPPEEVYKLGSLLKNSDIVICFYSSIMIEASIFDTPVISIALYTKNNLPDEVVRNHNHNKRVLDTGGVTTVHDKDSLIASINRYLEDHSTDNEGRKMIVGQECGPNRGKAGVNIANYLMKLLKIES